MLEIQCWIIYNEDHGAPTSLWNASLYLMNRMTAEMRRIETIERKIGMALGLFVRKSVIMLTTLRYLSTKL